MAEIDDLGNEVKTSKIINVHKIGKVEYELDQSVLNDPDKINIEQVSKVLGCSKSHARFLSGEDQENWPKINALVDGKMYAFYSKKLILEYKAKKDKKDSLQVSDAEIKTSFQPAGESAGSSQSSGPGNAATAPTVHEGERFPALSKELEQRVSVTLSNVETVLSKNEKEKNFLRILLPILFIFFCVLIVYLVENFNRTTKTILDLNNEVVKQKEQTYSAQASVTAKDAQIKFLMEQMVHPIQNQTVEAAPLK